MALQLEQAPHEGKYSLLQMSIDYLARLILPTFFEQTLGVRKLPSVISPNPGHFRRQTLNAEGGPKVPVLSLSIGSYDRPEGWNHRAHHLDARLGNANEDQSFFHAAQLSPIQVTLAALFVTDDVDQQLLVVERLFGETASLQFNTTLRDANGNDAMNLEHSVYLDFSYSPDEQDDTDSGDYHNLQFGVILKTWVGKLRRLPAVLTIQQENFAITRFTDDDLIIQPLGMNFHDIYILS